jgi:hypothetical protein
MNIVEKLKSKLPNRYEIPVLFSFFFLLISDIQYLLKRISFLSDLLRYIYLT